MSKLLGWVLSFLRPASSWLVDVATGITRGAIRGLVEVSHEPQKVRTYATTAKRIEQLNENLESYRKSVAERRRRESAGG